MKTEDEYINAFANNPILSGESKKQYYVRIGLLLNKSWKTIKEYYSTFKAIHSEAVTADTSQTTTILKTVPHHTFEFLKDTNYNPFDLLEPIDDSVKEFTLPFFRKIGHLTDIHLPFYNKAALILAIDAMRKYEPDCLWLNGDIADAYAISRWIKEKKKEDLQYEIDCVREFLRVMREMFPKAAIYYKIGNHEERWDFFLHQNAKVFQGIDDFELSSVFRMEKYGIHLVEGKTITKTGKLFMIHGHEVHGGGGVFPARSMFMKTFKNTIFGHCHRTSEYINKAINNEIEGCWSVASLSQLRPNYSPINQYGNGFAFIEMCTDGTFEVMNKKIINGKIC